jgi:sec-independent protein translocase protein TatC
MLPIILQFFIQSNTILGLSNLFSVEPFFEFIALNLFMGGLVFQTPLILVMANKIGILPREWLTGSRRMAFIVILLIAGIVTPDHSIISQLILGGVMYLLFELSILFMKGKTEQGE